MIHDLVTFKERTKSLRFVLEPIDYGIRLSHKKFISTDFFFQKVDICITNKEDVIIALYENVKSEKRLFKIKAYSVYFLPLGTCKNLKVGEKIKIYKK